MQTLLRVSRLIDGFTIRVGKFAGVLATIMILVGVFNVLTRYIGDFFDVSLASNAYIETQWYLFSIVFFFGFAYIVHRNENVRVDFLYANWGPKRKALVNLLGTIFFFIPFCIMGIIVTYQPVLFSWRIRETSSDPGGLARYPIKTMIIVAFVLLLLQSISELIKHSAVLTDAISPTEEEAVETYRHEFAE